MGEAETKPERDTPRRWIAILFCLVGPMGIGQFYLGRRKRGVAWLALALGASLIVVLALTPLGAVLGYGLVLALLFAGAILALGASVLDVLRIPAARFARVAKLQLGAFWLAGAVLSPATSSVLRRHVIEAFKIPSGAMQPTLLVGDHIMVDKLSHGADAPKRGEPIVFKFPEPPELDFVKRVIALPGDSLSIRQGHPWLNGWEVPHCVVGKTTLPDPPGGCPGTLEVEFLDGEAYLVFVDDCAPGPPNQGPYVVAPGELWVLGDNRNNSLDSPAWGRGRGAGLPFANVKGRALFVWYSRAEWARFGAPLAKPLLPASMASLGPALEKCLASRPPREKTVPPSHRE